MASTHSGKSLSQKEREQRREAGLALVAQRGNDYMRELGRRGGRPTFWQAVEKARAREEARKQRRGRPPGTRE